MSNKPLYDALPNQVTVKTTTRGTSFNLMVVGPREIGKTTLINSLFDFDAKKDSPDFDRGVDDVELRIQEFKPAIRNLQLKLTIIETKGFNDRLDRSEMYKPIIDYIESRYDDYYRNKKLNVTEYNDFSDSRVHCCIYMIQPCKAGLNPIDLVTMKKLHQRVCLIPVIGKSDQLTSDERHSIKHSIMKAIGENKIEIFQSGSHDLPFAVAASDEKDPDYKNKHRRVRIYPWGKLYIDHTDFPKLKDLLLSSNMLSLIATTNNVHYEKYRAEVTKQIPDTDSLRDYAREKKQLLEEIEKEEIKIKRSGLAY